MAKAKTRKISSNRTPGIANYNKFGGSTSGYRAGGAGIVAGVRDPASGRIIKGPKPQNDLGIKAGGPVKVTNPDALGSRQARRNNGIGMGSGSLRS